MFTKTVKTPENKRQAIADQGVSNQRNFISPLTDNRPETIQRRNLQQLADHHGTTQLKSLQKSSSTAGSMHIIQRQVIQFTIDELIQLVKNNDKKGFGVKLRSMDPGMDELLSCETTFELAREAFLEGDLARVRELCTLSHETRLPTQWTGGREILGNGEESAWAHPTATVDTMPVHPWDMPVGNSGTHYRSSGHTSFNNERRKAVLSEKGEPKQRVGTAIGFTLSRVPPPFAPGVVVNSGIPEEEKEDFNRKRDDIKRKHPKFDPSKKQKRNAPFVKDEGNVSPLREESDDDG